MGVVIEHPADRGVDHELGGAVWGVGAADELFGEPALAGGNWGGDQEGYGSVVACGDEDLTVLEVP